MFVLFFFSFSSIESHSLIQQAIYSPIEYKIKNQKKKRKETKALIIFIYVF